MKNPGNIAGLLDLPYAPEADAMLDELERSGQFRVGLEAELEEEDDFESGVANDYAWGRGSGSVIIQDWWTSGHVTLRVGPGVGPEDLVLARIGDSLLVRTYDGFDRALIDGYLGLIPDASTLRIIFGDGTEWSGARLTARISSMLTEAAAGNAD